MPPPPQCWDHRHRPQFYGLGEPTKDFLNANQAFYKPSPFISLNLFCVAFSPKASSRGSDWLENSNHKLDSARVSC